MVEINGERVLAPSCCRAPTKGMVVQTASDRARKSQALVLELLQADMPETALTRRNEVDFWAEWLKVGKPRFAPRPEVMVDASHPAIAVDLNACIQCTRCLRACRDEQMNDVIGLALRGEQAKIVFDMDDPMGASTCVACGECVQACPTGALGAGARGRDGGARQAGGIGVPVLRRRLPAHLQRQGQQDPLRQRARRPGQPQPPVRQGPLRLRLCAPPAASDEAADPSHRCAQARRLHDGPERRDDRVPRGQWDEALDVAGGTLKRLRAQHGRYALAGFGSAKGSNEEAYLFQKLVRMGFGSNNVDHCTRLCHASSVAALLEGIGSGAVSNPVMDVTQAEVVILIGANPTVNHPVAATWMKNAVAGGTKLIVMDPRRSELTRYAHRYLQFKADTDVALLNAMMHVIVEEGLVDQKFIADRTLGYDALAQNVKGYSPEAMAPICGIDAETIREVARLYATSKGSMILWGMGISQHVHGTDNARCLIALSLMTGQIGRPGTGLHPLRGQNNVQGASDAGLIPMMYPDYQRVDNKDAKARFASAWKVAPESLDDKPGLTVVEVIKAIDAGTIKGMYIMGENPAMSDPDADHARDALATLEMLVVQDIFLTETAYLADVILPASAFPEKYGSFTNTDRMVQLGRQALEPPGQARQDLWIIRQLAQRIGVPWPDYGAGQSEPAAFQHRNAQSDYL